jgi:hypothetical protein
MQLDPVSIKSNQDLSSKSSVISEILLVDLAGSERQSDTQEHDPARIQESIQINASLSALKDCLRARSLLEQQLQKQSSDKLEGAPSKAKKQQKRIPYRSSKLTMVLKDLLDPPEDKEARTIVIATVSPTIADASHTLQTFRYACALNPSLNSILQQDSHSVPKKSTPMSWSIEKLDSWLTEQSHGSVSLLEILPRLQEDLAMKQTDPDYFFNPPWKALYDMTEKEWEDRGGSQALRTVYRGLFIQSRPTVIKAEGLTDAVIETLPLAELSPYQYTRSTHPPVQQPVTAQPESPGLSRSQAKLYSGKDMNRQGSTRRSAPRESAAGTSSEGASKPGKSRAELAMDKLRAQGRARRAKDAQPSF